MKNKILFVACLLTGLMFINSGLNKFFNYIPMPEDLPEEVMTMFEAMMTITWLMPLIAIFEIIGGVLLIIPKWRALGILILVPLMVGILAHHITLGDYNPVPFVMAAILIWAGFENKERYLPIIKS
ncbi:putative membrane protein YphA (DoxX/SURF4 family) [Algoriphagus sp. 4150]|uniref:DoxX family protein n=1 Tax=Algoriphagus sp. 4150 TaxID=2817756 RepID=UPI0028603BE0|nr:DoxX family protein [Algoriphagus sp. 4150]MDR7128109.1 putative membrane protein YphA (DoxX/SURF4 family) [Algoriphagus sp. 4150]